MISFIRVALPFLLLITAFSCNTTDPPGEDNTILKWDVDTITYPESFQTIMKTMWGNSINDLWVAGHNNRGYGKAFHFDGKVWKDFSPVSVGIFDSYAFTSSLNLGDEVFLCGEALYRLTEPVVHFADSSLILSLKGNQWNVSQLANGRFIQTISGSKNGKIYAAGWGLTLFSYENSHWIRKTVNLEIPPEWETRSINSVLVAQNQNGYMSIYCYDPNPLLERYYFAVENENGWEKVDSFDTGSDKWGMDFWESSGGNIYSYNPGIYKLINNTWSRIFNKYELITALKGTDDNNIYAAGHGVYHFDGKDWYEYKELYNKYGLARDILLLDDNVFILFSNSTNSFVLKGHK